MAQLNVHVHENASQYPENLSQHSFWNCNLADYRQRLQANSCDLFGDELGAQLDIIQLNGTSRKFERKAARTDVGLMRMLNEHHDHTTNGSAPKCQHL